MSEKQTEMSFKYKLVELIIAMIIFVFFGWFGHVWMVKKYTKDSIENLSKKIDSAYVVHQRNFNEYKVQKKEDSLEIISLGLQIKLQNVKSDSLYYAFLNSKKHITVKKLPIFR